jgi:hypothetical protein
LMVKAQYHVTKLVGQEAPELQVDLGLLIPACACPCVILNRGDRRREVRRTEVYSGVGVPGGRTPSCMPRWTTRRKLAALRLTAF